MHAWFELAMPWWEFVVRAAASYIGLLCLMRFAGKHAFGEMSPFDIVVLILVGGAMRSAIVGSDTSLLGPFIGVATILVLDKLLALVAARSRVFGLLLEGRTILLARAGRLLPQRLQRHGISRETFDRELRNRNVSSLDDVDAVYLEANGKISVLRKPSSPKSS